MTYKPLSIIPNNGIALRLKPSVPNFQPHFKTSLFLSLDSFCFLSPSFCVSMAKGNDIVTRKKNKANRKKLNSQTQSSSSVSARVAALIAAKKRRKSGTRRKCQVIPRRATSFSLHLICFCAFSYGK